MESNNYPGSYYQPLFDLLNQEHGITPLESEMTDIIEVVEKMRGRQTGPRWVKAIDRNPPVNTRLHLKVKGVNHVGFWDAPANCYVTFLDNAYPITDVEWLDESAAVSQDAHEKEIMMQAFDKVRQIFEGRQWVMDGRGSYPYNDDRYKEEVRYMYNEFDEVVKDTWANINSKSVDYRKAIIAEYLEQPAAGREEDAVAFVNWTLSSECDTYTCTDEDQWTNIYTQENITTAELYELFKQQKENP